jgi:hypothetical protein
MGTTDDPEVGNGPESSVSGTVGLIATVAAFVVAQVIVDVWPPFTSVGLALNCVIWGTIFGVGGVVLVALHPSCQKVRITRWKAILEKSA